jgi:alpha-D-ribose 1-methylphosphonate 5-triphosphate synthase subunit PhnL
MLLEVIEPPSKEVLETIRSEFGLNEQRVREAIEHLKNWIELQPHLPKEIGKFGKDTVNSISQFLTVGIKSGVLFCVRSPKSTHSRSAEYFNQNE